MPFEWTTSCQILPDLIPQAQVSPRSVAYSQTSPRSLPSRWMPVSEAWGLFCPKPRKIGSSIQSHRQSWAILSWRELSNHWARDAGYSVRSQPIPPSDLWSPDVTVITDHAAYQSSVGHNKCKWEACTLVAKGVWLRKWRLCTGPAKRTEMPMPCQGWYLPASAEGVCEDEVQVELSEAMALLRNCFPPVQPRKLSFETRHPDGVPSWWGLPVTSLDRDSTRLWSMDGGGRGCIPIQCSTLKAACHVRSGRKNPSHETPTPANPSEPTISDCWGGHNGVATNLLRKSVCDGFQDFLSQFPLAFPIPD